MLTGLPIVRAPVRVVAPPAPPLPGKRKYAAITDAQLKAERDRHIKRLVGEYDLRRHERWQATGSALEQPEERRRREALRQEDERP